MFLSKVRFVFMLLPVGGVVALDYPSPPPPDVYIVDQAGVITPDYEARINELCREVERRTSAEMAVLTISTTSGEDVAMYATELGNRWGVGQASEDNGLVMVVAVSDRQVFTATGSGMEGYLPDARIDQIYRKVLVPHFKKGQYGEGIYKALQVYAAEIGKEYKVRFENARGAPHVGTGWFKKVWNGYICPGLVILFVLMIIASLFIKTPKGSSSSSSASYWSSSSSSSSSWSSSSSSSHSSSGGSFGGGSFSGGGGGGGW